MDMIDRIDEAMERTCYVIDYLPMLVPNNPESHFNEVYSYLEDNNEEIMERFSRFTLKLLCYHKAEFCIDGEEEEDYEIEDFADEMEASGDVIMYFKKEDAVLRHGSDDLYMALYNPSAQMLALCKMIADSENLFIRKEGEVLPL